MRSIVGALGVSCLLLASWGGAGERIGKSGNDHAARGDHASSAAQTAPVETGAQAAPQGEPQGALQGAPHVEHRMRDKGARIRGERAFSARAASPVTSPRTRRNISGLSPESPEIAALKRGVAEMKRRSKANPADPTGWIFQANIHGNPEDPIPPPAHRCQHGSFFFLSWHRMYLYWFERILRSASGDPDLSIPYWKYSTAEERVLPIAFRQPNNPSNPLYEAGRSPDINRGLPMHPAVSNIERVFIYTNFSSPRGSALSLGGPILLEPQSFASPPGQLELQPHNAVHGLVGGGDGLMNDPQLAARDPIFWLHHANIDRLWKRWLDLMGGRSMPAREGDEAIWWSHPFEFYDEQGRRVTMTGADIVDTANQLGYVYDDDPPTERATFGEELDLDRFAAAAPVSARGPASNLVVATNPGGAFNLGASPMTVTVEPTLEAGEIGGTANEGQAPPTGVGAGRIALNVEGIRFSKNPGLVYEVYVGLPEGETPDYRSPYFVGLLSFFDVPRRPTEPGRTLTFDITETTRLLGAQGLWPGRQPVTFVPYGGPTAATARPRSVNGAAPFAAPAERRLRGREVTIERLSITTE